jgi:hypothetical protein
MKDYPIALVYKDVTLAVTDLAGNFPIGLSF